MNKMEIKQEPKQEPEELGENSDSDSIISKKNDSSEDPEDPEEPEENSDSYSTITSTSTQIHSSDDIIRRRGIYVEGQKHHQARVPLAKAKATTSRMLGQITHRKKRQSHVEKKFQSNTLLQIKRNLRQMDFDLRKERRKIDNLILFQCTSLELMKDARQYILKKVIKHSEAKLKLTELDRTFQQAKTSLLDEEEIENTRCQILDIGRTLQANLTKYYAILGDTCYLLESLEKFERDKMNFKNSTTPKLSELSALRKLASDIKASLPSNSPLLDVINNDLDELETDFTNTWDFYTERQNYDHFDMKVFYPNRIPFIKKRSNVEKLTITMGCRISQQLARILNTETIMAISLTSMFLVLLSLLFDDVSCV